MKRILWTSFFIVFFSPLSTYAFDSPASTYLPGTRQKDWQANISVSYDTGDFGTDTTTETTYVPLTIKRYFEKGDLAWTVPFIYQKSGRSVTAIGGHPFRTSSASGGNTRSASGLGDMLLKGGYYLLDENNAPLNLSPVAKIKFPTADDEKGLGTGEFDETVGLESSKSLNREWSAYLDLYYTFIGDPPGADLENEFAVAIGPGYHFSDQTMLGLFYQERTALVDDRPNPRDLILELNHQMDDTTGALGAVSVGLSNGSPDVGVTVGLNKQF